jgi:hypothetical protein
MHRSDVFVQAASLWLLLTIMRVVFSIPMLDALQPTVCIITMASGVVRASHNQ